MSSCRPSQNIAPAQSSERSRSPKNLEATVEDYADLKGPTLLKRTLGLQRRHHGLHLGSGGKFERSLAPGSWSASNLKLPNDLSFRHVGSHDTFVIRPDAGTEIDEDEVADLDAIENLVSPHGRALIDLYFRIVHPSFPILHKRVYLEKYERSHREFSPALLAAVYILATAYWTYSPELSCSPLPNVVLLERLAIKALTYTINRPKLSTVEAGLLLLQRSNKASWPLAAQMVAVGQDLGLHRECSDWDIPEWEKGLRKRLGWALYMQDKWASLVNGRPSHILETDWAVGALDDQDFPENFADEDDEAGSTEVVKGRSLFKCMRSLTIILSEILSTLYSGTAEEAAVQEGSNATIHVLMKAKPLQIKLKEWYASLPKSLGIEHVKVRKLSSNGYLHLAYWATEITLHRCIARTLPFCSDPHLVSVCYSAASARLKSAMDFVKTLKPEHWQSFWYFASEFNFGLIGVFETLVSNSLCLEHDASETSARLDAYRWNLKMASHNAGFLERSIFMLDVAAADNSLNKRKPASRDPCSKEEEMLGSLSSDQLVEPDITDNAIDNHIQWVEWPTAQSPIVDDSQPDYDQISWPQNTFLGSSFSIGSQNTKI